MFFSSAKCALNGFSASVNRNSGPYAALEMFPHVLPSALFFPRCPRCSTTSQYFVVSSVAAALNTIQYFVVAESACAIARRTVVTTPASTSVAANVAFASAAFGVSLPLSEYTLTVRSPGVPVLRTIIHACAVVNPPPVVHCPAM